MKLGTDTKVKFKKLKRQLGLVQWEAVGLLESIWQFTSQNCPQGDIGKFDNEEIAASIEWANDADILVDALVNCGWLDESAFHRLVVHDWDQHCPNYIKGALARHNKEFAKADGAIPTESPRAPRNSRDSRYVPKPHDYEQLRLSILDRDGGKCRYCGAEATQVDHILEQIRGGEHTPDNMVSCCSACNGSLLGQDEATKRSKLRANPSEQRANPSEQRANPSEQDSTEPKSPTTIPYHTTPCPTQEPSQAIPEPSPNGEGMCGASPRTEYGFPLRDGKTWYLTQKKYDEYRDTFEGDGVNLPEEFRKARQWLRDNKSKRKTAGGMPKFLTGWLNTAASRGPPRSFSDATGKQKYGVR